MGGAKKSCGPFVIKWLHLILTKRVGSPLKYIYYITKKWSHPLKKKRFYGPSSHLPLNLNYCKKAALTAQIQKVTRVKGDIKHYHTLLN
jgi:hypothetical protein